MSLSAEAQALFDHARQSLPRWLTSSANAALEWLYAFTDIMDTVRTQGQDWIDITYFDNATGIELDQHALDRGTTRRSGETDDVLRERLRNITDQVTEPALLIGVNTILTTLGLKAWLRVPTSRANSQWYTIFESKVAGGIDLTLTAKADPTLVGGPTLVENGKATTITFNPSSNHKVSQIEALVTSSSTLFQVKTAGSFPNYVLLDVDDEFTNYPFSLAYIVCLRRDRIKPHTPGLSTFSFLNRGYRLTRIGRPMAYIFILPYTTTAVIASAVAEYLRQNGPAGYIYYVERRLNP